MSNVEITPELLRAVVAASEEGNWLSEGPHDALRFWANELERQQDDEKRIDELAVTFWDAVLDATEYGISWPNLHEDARKCYRAGIRAVLAKLDQGREDTLNREIKRLNDEPRKWYDLRDVPEDVETVTSNTGTRIGRTVCLPQGWSWRGLNMTGVSTWWKWDAPFTEVRD